ncbi:MAG: hypothetical protein K6G80_00055 [Treponema sp.]|nr:hypothetical protein [Treponema sp.]
MIKAVVYKDLSDAYELVLVKARVSAREAFKHSVQNWRNAVLLVNGTVQQPDYVLKESDIVAVRSVPHASVAAALGVSTLAVWLMAGGAAVLAAGGAYLGYLCYEAKKEAERAQDRIDELKNSTSNDVINLPYLKGASNTTATGKTQPYIMGAHLFTPYILNGGGSGSYTGYHSISGDNGETLFYTVVLEGGFNKQVIRKIRTDNITIKSFDTETPQEYPNDNGDTRFSLAADSVFASSESFGEIAQDGEAFENECFNVKIVEEEITSQLLKADADDYEDLIFTLADYSMAADITILFNGLCYFNTDGTQCSRAVTVVPSYSFDYNDEDRTGDATWHDFEFTADKYGNVTHTGVYRVSLGTRSTAENASLEAKVASWVKSNFDSYSRTYVSGDALTDGDVISSVSVTSVSYSSSKTVYYGHDDNKSKIVYTGVTASVKVTFTRYEKTSDTTTTFSANTMTQLRYNAHVDFDFADLSYTDSDGNLCFSDIPVAIKLRCETNKVTSGTGYDGVYAQYVHSYPFNVKKSKAAGAFVAEEIIASREAQYSTRIGLRIESTTSNEDKLSKINVLTSGIAPVWDSTAKEWTRDSDGDFAREITSNPASWLLEVMTSRTHTPSQWEEDEIDLETFGTLYEICEEQGWTCDLVLTDGETKQAVLEKILGTCHGVLYRTVNGQIGAACDWYTDDVVGLINEQNCISFSYERDNSRVCDGIKATYIDGDTWEETNYIVMRDGSDADDRDANSTLREVTATGIVSHENVVTYCRYLMAIEKLRRRTITAEVGKEGIFYTPLSIIKVQHPSLKIGLGNTEIKALVYDSAGTYITGLELWEPVTLTEGDSYCVEIQCTDANGLPLTLVKQIQAYGGDTYAVTFTEPHSVEAEVKPEVGAVVAYGYVENGASVSMLITEIALTTSGYKLTLVDYNEAIYETGDIPDYDPHITTRRNTAQTTVTQNATQEDVAEATSTAIKAAQQAADLVTKGVTFSGTRYINGTTMSLEELVRYIDEAVQDASAGIQVTDESLTIKIEDTDAQTRSLIQQTASSILATVENYKDELSAALLITESAIDQIVTVNGTTAGRMSLSLELPAIIDADTRESLVSASSEAAVAAVYAKNSDLSGDSTTLYTIRTDAASSALKTLWTAAVSAGLIASQIDLTAANINISADNVVFTDGDGETSSIISGGKIQTELLDATAILAQEATISNTLTMGEGAVIKSSNYDGTVTGGVLNKDGTVGFAIDSNGNLDVLSGRFSGEINATSGTFSGKIIQGTPFYIATRIIISYDSDAADWKITCSNPDYQTVTYDSYTAKPLRVNTGRFAIPIPKTDHDDYGAPRILVHYCSDSYRANTGSATLSDFSSNAYSPGNSNPIYQCLCRSGLNIMRYLSDGTAVSYMPLYFTDNQNDSFVDPYYAILTIFYCGV